MDLNEFIYNLQLKKSKQDVDKYIEETLEDLQIEIDDIKFDIESVNYRLTFEDDYDDDEYISALEDDLVDFEENLEKLKINCTILNRIKNNNHILTLQEYKDMYKDYLFKQILEDDMLTQKLF